MNDGRRDSVGDLMVVKYGAARAERVKGQDNGIATAKVITDLEALD